MTLTEAYMILDLDHWVDDQTLKENYRWFIKLYHPDNKETGNCDSLTKVIQAYEIIRKSRNEF